MVDRKAAPRRREPENRDPENRDPENRDPENRDTVDAMGIATETTGRTLVVTIDRPQRRNAVDRTTAGELHRAFVAFDADGGLDVAVLTGAGGNFCAGADLHAIGTGGGNRVSDDPDAPAPLEFLYPDEASLADKIRAIATRTYGASDVVMDAKVKKRVAELQAGGYGHFPVCVAKTQSSFSGDASVRGAPDGHVLTVREVRLAAGAGFIVMVCGDMLTMPGLPKVPAAEHIGVTDDGRITGLS